MRLFRPVEAVIALSVIFVAGGWRPVEVNPTTAPATACRAASACCADLVKACGSVPACCVIPIEACDSIPACCVIPIEACDSIPACCVIPIEACDSIPACRTIQTSAAAPTCPSASLLRTSADAPNALEGTGARGNTVPASAPAPRRAPRVDRQLGQALNQAWASGKPILVGLTGSDTCCPFSRFEVDSLSTIVDDQRIIEASRDFVSIIIRRPHAY